MSEAPGPVEDGNDWMNRIIGLVIALACLAFGVTLLVGAVDGVLGALDAGDLPSIWVVLSVLLGVGLTAMGGMFAWKSVMSGHKRG
jgi:TRAP-type C4-dicarboxylate transport system permease small subunit